MKKIVLMGWCMALLLAAPLVSAYFFEVDHVCSHNNTCVVGQQINWTLTVTNDGRRVLDFTRVEFTDIFSLEVIGGWVYQFNPFTSVVQDVFTVGIGKTHGLNITGVVPEQNIENALVYQPCVTNVVDDSYYIARYDAREVTQCYHINITIPVIDCIEQDHCAADEYCSFNTCLPLQCESCQFIEDHQCKNYQCCIHEQCAFNQQCVDNTCKQLNCEFDEYIDNRTCVSLNCAEDETVINRTCVPLDCAYNERPLNGSCHALDCPDDHQYLNHACVALSCRIDEHIVNHTCQSLNCLRNETFVDNTCQPLKCWFYEQQQNHYCVMNWPVTVKLSIEALIVLGILAFVVLDARTYLKNRKQVKPKHLKDTKRKLSEEKPTQTTKKPLSEQLKEQEKVPGPEAK